MKLSADRTVLIEPTFDAWRSAARALLGCGTPPSAVDYADTDSPSVASLFDPDPIPHFKTVRRTTVSKVFVDRARVVACHRAPERWNILYLLLWRLQQERNLLSLEIDPDVALFRRLEHQVKRDLHKMHAFVRALPQGYRCGR